MYTSNIFNIRRFKNGATLYWVTMSLGDDMSVFLWGREFPNCRFVKVTRKGFNILNLDTSRCLLKQHLYMEGMANKEFGHYGAIRGHFMIPHFVSIKLKPK